ncbi:MAG: hypothetical protein LUE10_02585 [Alistipes sp.]|nr:hypothetical protein [Alistipes sp.]
MAEKEIRAGSQGARYVVVLNTDFTEPGFNVGVARKSASINMTGQVFETGSEVPVATFTITKCSAKNLWGTDFDTGYRIQECYAKAGREFAKFLIKKKIM